MIEPSELRAAALSISVNLKEYLFGHGYTGWVRCAFITNALWGVVSWCVECIKSPIRCVACGAVQSTVVFVRRGAATLCTV
jgi:hypothetical protein